MKKTAKKQKSLQPPELTHLIELLATDFDGTLIEQDNESSPIQPGFFDRLAQLRTTGRLVWVINTGRPLPELERQLHLREVPVWPDWVVVLEREIWRVHAQERRLISWDEWNERCTVVHNELFAQVGPFWREVELFIRAETEAIFLKDPGSPVALKAKDHEEADRISAHVAQLLPSWPKLAVMRASMWFRFCHVDYNKGSCMQAIARHLEIPREKVMAIGDGLNDLHMLHRSVAEFIACPGNAADSVKKQVIAEQGYISQANDVEGVIESIDHFLRKNNKNKNDKDNKLR